MTHFAHPLLLRAAALSTTKSSPGHQTSDTAIFSPKTFDPGDDMVHYAGRVFDAEEIVNLVDAGLNVRSCAEERGVNLPRLDPTYSLQAVAL